MKNLPDWDSSYYSQLPNVKNKYIPDFDGPWLDLNFVYNDWLRELIHSELAKLKIEF